jgi:lipopolysaccharide biosynthesis glycosyltransferase
MRIPKFDVWVGYDPRESLNLDVCGYSLRKHSGYDFPCTILNQDTLRAGGYYWREQDKASTSFSLTRFLTPYLSKHYNPDIEYSIFIDSDNIITRDIREVFLHMLECEAVGVVKHDYVPRQSVKMDGCKQEAYPRKNWSSFIVFRNDFCREALPLEVVNTHSPAFLHRFGWCPDRLIAPLPIEFNYLVGEDMPVLKQLPINLHYTNGSPMFPEYDQCDFNEVWKSYKQEMDNQC